jgi:hypothetical protein
MREVDSDRRWPSYTIPDLAAEIALRGFFDNYWMVTPECWFSQVVKLENGKRFLTLPLRCCVAAGEFQGPNSWYTLFMRIFVPFIVLSDYHVRDIAITERFNLSEVHRAFLNKISDFATYKSNEGCFR